LNQNIGLYFFRQSTIRYRLSVLSGDQIGRLFAYWVIVHCEEFDENYRNSSKLWAIFSSGKIPMHQVLTNIFRPHSGGNFYSRCICSIAI
jgi:hypothetical protein